MAENSIFSPYCTIADSARTPLPRQEILSPGQRAQLLVLPTDARQISECYTFSPADLDLIAQCRGDQNRLGFAVQLGFLRYPGRAWTPAESIPEPMLGDVAGQLGVPPDDFAGYASRDQTRREHLARLVATFGWRTFGLQEHREVSAWLLALARGDDLDPPLSPRGGIAAAGPTPAEPGRVTA